MSSTLIPHQLPPAFGLLASEGVAASFSFCVFRPLRCQMRIICFSAAMGSRYLQGWDSDEAGRVLRSIFGQLWWYSCSGTSTLTHACRRAAACVSVDVAWTLELSSSNHLHPHPHIPQPPPASGAGTFCQSRAGPLVVQPAAPQWGCWCESPGLGQVVYRFSSRTRTRS